MNVKDFINTYRDRDNVFFAIYNTGNYLLCAMSIRENEYHFERVMNQYGNKHIKEWDVTVTPSGFTYNIILQ